jgi:hypothetical protein
MRDAVKQLLTDGGPCLSTDLSQKLVDIYGMKPDAARKRVSRGCVGLKRLAHLPFPRKARFLYLEENFASPWYWEALFKAIRDSDSSYAYVLEALIQRDGILPKAHFQAACGAPKRQKKQLSAETILERMIKANVLVEIDVAGIGPCIVLKKHEEVFDSDVQKLRARLIAESVLLGAIAAWARNLNMSSSGTLSIRTPKKQPAIGPYAWDLTGPCYLYPLRKVTEDRKVRPGFIACDVLLGSMITEGGLRPFLRKCSNLRSLRNIGHCLQIFVVDGYSHAAFDLARSQGIIPATTESLFGKDVAKGLAQLIQVLEAAAEASISPEQFDELFNRLGKIEGAANQLRGALFEYMVAEIVRPNASALSINRICKTASGKQAEADVVYLKGRDELVFIECKGYHPAVMIDDGEISDWLTKRIPTLREYALEHPDWKSRKIRFELWLTGKISSEAEEKIDLHRAATKKYEIAFLDPLAVDNAAKSTENKKLISTYEQHFREDPIQQAQDAVSKKRARDRKKMQIRIV